MGRGHSNQIIAAKCARGMQEASRLRRSTSGFQSQPRHCILPQAMSHMEIVSTCESSSRALAVGMHALLPSVKALIHNSARRVYQSTTLQRTAPEPHYASFHMVTRVLVADSSPTDRRSPACAAAAVIQYLLISKCVA